MHSFHRVFSILLLLFSLNTQAQIIGGIVVDKDTQRPLEGVIVQVDDQLLITSAQGVFSLQVDQLPKNLFIHILGYQSKTITCSSEGFLIVPLEISDLELGEILITSTPLHTTLNQTSAGISLITPSMIRSQDNISLPSVLNQVPGVLVHQGTLSTNRITIRGIGTRNPFGTSKIRAYYEDIPLTNGNGETTVEDMDLATIGRIEILKGPNSSIFGAGLGGVINILPKYPEANERSAQSGFQYGSFGTYRWFNRFELGNEHGSLSLIHSKVNSQGYRENNKYRRESLTLLGIHRWSEKTKLSFIGNFIYLDAFIPSSIGYTSFKTQPKAAAVNWSTAKGYEEYLDHRLGVNFSHSISSIINLSASVFYIHHKNDEPRPRPLNILNEETDGAGYRVKVTTGKQRWQWCIGSEGFLDLLQMKVIENLYDNMGSGTIRGELLGKSRATRGYINSFVEGSAFLTDHLSMTSGLNFNQTFYNLQDRYLGDGNQSGDYQFDPILSPRVGLLYKTSPANFFINISHGFSTPTLEETLLPSGVINPAIGPEKGWNFEVGTRGSIKALSFETNLYWMEISDLLVSRRDINDQFIGINAGKTRNLGYEQSLNYLILKGRMHELSIHGNLSIQNFKFQKFIDGDNDFSGNQLTGVPKNQLNGILHYKSTDGPYFNLNYRYIGKMPITDDNSINNSGYGLLNLRAGYTKRFKYWDIETYVGVQNLTNIHYAGMVQVNANGFGGAEPRYYYPGLPINFFTGLSLKYTL